MVPGRPRQFAPRRSGDRLIGRGAYDMKAALGAMMLALSDLVDEPPPGLEVTLVIVPDEERADPGSNCTDMLVEEGLRGDFVICGEPTDMQVGVQSKGGAHAQGRRARGGGARRDPVAGAKRGPLRG